MGQANLNFWLRFLRRIAVGWVLIYVPAVIVWGGTSAARPIVYGLSGFWVLLLSVRTCGTLTRSVSEGQQNPTLTLRVGILGNFRCAQRWFEVAATNVAVTLVLAEVALQGWAVFVHSSPLVRANLDAYRLIPGRDYGEGLYGNSRGYPGPELAAEKTPGVLRIAAIGDSFAVGPAVPFADNFLTRLPKELAAVEVGNFGVSGAGPREYREILERDVWAVHPDIVLLCVFVGNDITEALPRPRSFDPRRHALFLLCQRGCQLARGLPLTDNHCNRLAAPPLSPEVFRAVEARCLAVCIKNAPTSLERQWRRALADLEGIVQACQDRGVTLAVVLIPDEFQVNNAVLQDAMSDAGVTPEELDRDGPQRRLQALFAQRQVRCLDLLPALRQEPATYAPLDTHWNIAGNHLAARQVAAWLLNTESN